jgi:adenylylsulfate kinase-like enzyme
MVLYCARFEAWRGASAAMMIWINGAFGAGKTTLAEELHRRLPDALAFDPEYVGYILRLWVPAPESEDFQDIPLWRKLVAEFAIGMSAAYGRALIIPMTLVNPAYREEIFGLISTAGEHILHVFLDVPPEELHRRVDAQALPEDNPRRMHQLARSGIVTWSAARRPGLSFPVAH